MKYYHISGSKGSYSIFTRDTEAKYPFLTSLFNRSGSSSNVRSWKTEKGLRRFVEKNYPNWVFESSEEFKERRINK